MPALKFATEAYNRVDYFLPEARLVNMFAEVGDPIGLARLPRPGLRDSGGTPGVGPIRKLFSESGAFGGDLITCSGQHLYIGEDVIAGPDLNLSGNVRIAVSQTQIAVVCDGNLYVYNGTNYVQVDDFYDTGDDLPQFIDCVLLGGRLVLLTADGTLYWSQIGDFTQIGSLNFATAESKPDAGVALVVRGQQLAVFGAGTVEWWYLTADPDLPYQRMQNAGYDRGCASQESVANFDNTLVWVGENRIAYRAGAVPERISNHGIEARLQECSDIASLRVFVVPFDGHEFAVFNIPGQGTFVFDAAASSPDAAWSQWTSYSRTLFRGRCAVTIEGVTYIGDDTLNKVYILDRDELTDNGDPIERIGSAVYGVGSGVQRCDRVMLQCLRGVGNDDEPDPEVEMRYSDDAGRTWSPWRARPMGMAGQFKRKAIWRRQGSMRSPRRGFEWRTSAPVLVVYEGATINEPRP